MQKCSVKIIFVHKICHYSQSYIQSGSNVKRSLKLDLYCNYFEFPQCVNVNVISVNSTETENT